jgi:hypothetical protein
VRWSLLAVREIIYRMHHSYFYSKGLHDGDVVVDLVAEG